MPDNRYIAIGDIHGCFRTLDAMLRKIEHEEATFIFLGDYIDRGPDPGKCIDLLMEFNRNHNCVFLRGNHEGMLLDAVNTGNPGVWLINGCKTTLESFGTDAHSLQIPDIYLEFIRSTRIFYETDKYFFVHAGLKPEMTIEEAKNSPDAEYIFLWERSYIYQPKTQWEKTVVVGHTPVHQAIFRENLINIDTGCVYKNRGFGVLSAVRLPERTLISQNCIDSI